MRIRTFQFAAVFLILLSVAPAARAQKTQLMWYGQSAFKITTPSGKVLLIDPWITNSTNATGKADMAGLKRVDLITHAHFDHVGDSVTITFGPAVHGSGLVMQSKQSQAKAELWRTRQS